MPLAERASDARIAVVSGDESLLSSLDQLPFAVVAVPPDGPRPAGGQSASVLLLDAAHTPLERLREIRSELPHHVSVVLSAQESQLFDDQRIVGADDAELRDLGAARFARRLRSWNDLAKERYDAALLQQALDASINGVCIADGRVRGFPITYVSQTFELMTGYTRAECIGRSCRFLQGEDTSPDAIGALSEALRNGSRATVVLRNYRKDGAPFWNELTLVPLRDDRGEVASVMGVQHDVTQLMAARLLHRETEERAAFMATLLDGVDALLTADENGCVTFANRALERLLRRPLASMLGLDAASLLCLPPEAERALRLGRPTTLELCYELVNADGGSLAVDLTLRASAADGAAWIATLRDSAELAKREVEREQARRLVAVGSMLAGLVHEIRNPLATMSLLLGEVAESSDEGNALLVSKVHRQLNRVTRIVREAALFARPHRPLRAVVDARGIAMEVLEGLRSRMAERQILAEVECADAACAIYADEKQVIQLLAAVVSNALDAARSRVVVRVARNEDATTFTIVDDGPGIDEADRARVFEPFFTTKSNGSGLGLAIARRLAEEQGGTLTLHETSASGTTFLLRLRAEVGA